MWILFAAFLILAVVIYCLGNKREKKILTKTESGEPEGSPQAKQIDNECCGQHELCEHDSLLAAVSKKIEYYDDEELDQYKGIPENEYTLEQVEQFREILYTMQETDVAGWGRSLQLRGINLPDELKDELFMILGERRIQTK